MYVDTRTPFTGGMPAGMPPGMPMGPGMHPCMAAGMAPGMYPGMAPGFPAMQQVATSPSAGQAGVVSIPMNQGGRFTDRYFDPIFSSALPMEWPEFSNAIEEINGVCASAYPYWQRVLPCAMIPCGFVTFAAGGFTMFETAGFNGPSPLAFVMIAIAFLMFGGGALGSVCCMAKRNASRMTSLRFKLSELNARYAGRGIDFQLHQSSHLEMYHRNSFNHGHHGHSGGGMAVRNVTHYTLVVQALGDTRAIPAPEVVMAQAMRGASAPPMQASM